MDALRALLGTNQDAPDGNDSESPSCGATPRTQFAPVDQLPSGPSPSQVRVAASAASAGASVMARNATRTATPTSRPRLRRGTMQRVPASISSILGPRWPRAGYTPRPATHARAGAARG